MSSDLQTKCCVCLPVRKGLLLWAYFKTILSMVVFVPYLVLAADEVQHGVLLVPMFIGWVVVADVALNIVLIVGAHTDNYYLLKIYFCYLFGHMVSVFGLGLFGIVWNYPYNAYSFSFTAFSVLAGYIVLLSYINYIVRYQYKKAQKRSAMEHTTDSFTCNLPYTIMGDEKIAIVNCAKFEKMLKN